MIYDWIEIGTSDFDTLSKEHENDDTIGLSVEPNFVCLENFRVDRYKQVACVAIDKVCRKEKIYRIKPDKYDWFKREDRGCVMLGKIHPILKERVDKLSGNINDYIEESEVECYTIKKLFEVYNVEQVKYLKIDVEGLDCMIVNQVLDYFDNDRTKLPKNIVFEAVDWTDRNEINRTSNRLINYGYDIGRKDVGNGLVTLDIYATLKG